MAAAPPPLLREPLQLNLGVRQQPYIISDMDLPLPTTRSYLSGEYILTAALFARRAGRIERES